MKTLAAIRGVPLRKIVSRTRQGRRYLEILICGHTHLSDDLKDYWSKYRRCYTCKREKDRSGQ